MSTLYTDGTVTISAGSNIVNGTGTLFQSIGLVKEGDLLTVDGSVFFEIYSISNETQILIRTIPDGLTYQGANLTNVKYAIVRNFTYTTTASLATKLASIQNKWHQREEDITGWIASTDATYNVTDVFGNSKALVTPTEIDRIASQAVTVASDMAAVESRIANAETDLDGITPSLTSYYADRGVFDTTLASAYTDFANSETNAKNSENASASSAATAANSASQAAASLASVESIFDQFDDRYLGSKTSDPTVDNDGNPLLVGTIYWNSTTSDMHVWNGSVWESPEASASNAASNALASENNSATSASNAASSASASLASEQAAATSETNASTSATQSASSASAASTSESNSALSESNAATSATNAATSETNAQSWYNQAQSAVDSIGSVNKTMNFANFNIDASGNLIVEYNGVQDSSAFSINSNGELEVTI